MARRAATEYRQRTRQRGGQHIHSLPSQAQALRQQQGQDYRESGKMESAMTLTAILASTAAAVCGAQQALT